MGELESTFASEVILLAAARAGLSAERILSKARIPKHRLSHLRAGGPTIRIGEHLEILKAAHELTDRALLRSVGEIDFLENPMAGALASLPTLRRAQEFAHGVIAHCSTWVSPQLLPDGSRVRNVLAHSGRLDLSRQHNIELHHSLWITMLRQLDIPLHDVVLRFSHGRLHEREHYEAVFPGLQTEFDAPANEILYPAELFDRPMPYAGVRRYGPYLEDLLTSLAAVLPEAGQLVRLDLDDALLGRNPPSLQLEHVAGRIGVPARTVQHRLKSIGVSFRTLVDEARARHFPRLYAAHSDDRARLARHLGWDNERSLRRHLPRLLATTGAHGGAPADESARPPS